MRFDPDQYRSSGLDLLSQIGNADQAWWQLGLPMKNATSGRQGHFLAEWTVIASRTLILLI